MEENKTKQSEKLLSYKGYPLVRQGNIIYYGNKTDEFMIMMQIMEIAKSGDVEVATKIKVFRMLNDESLPMVKRIDKSADKESLYEALDIASIWLSRLVG